MSTLFLKYRPQTFTDVVGQTSIIKTLQNALKSENPSHAYLFSGSRGTGKTSTARIFAKGLNCPHLKDGNPCGKCEFCHDITIGKLVDIVEIDAASNRGIDEIRDLREKIQFAPTRTQRKVYIIDEVHMLTKEAFNALLKTLEEPPSHAFFLLATTEMHKLPETIVSRCQTFIFHRFSLDQLIDHLFSIAKKEKIKTDSEALQLIARKAEGGLRDAISLLEQISAETNQNITAQNVRDSLGISEKETLENFWEGIQNKDTPRCFEILKKINQSGKDFRTFGHDFLGFLREKFHSNLQDTDSLSTILPAIEAIQVALSRLKTSPIVELPLEIAVIELCRKKNKNSSNTIVTPTPTKSIPSKSSDTSISKKEKSSGFVFEKKITPPEQIESDIPKQKETVVDIDIEDEVNISVDAVSDRMNQIAEKAKIPVFAKKSFLTTKPRIEGEKIIFQADSHFHMDKLTKENVKIPLQNALIDLFQTSVIIDFEVAEIKREVATANDFLNF
jgi:DNA polymerase-3 subunit gamma/tau